MKNISRATLLAVLDDLKANDEGAAFLRVCERPLDRDPGGDVVAPMTVEIIERLLVGFLNHPGTSAETRALVAMARVRLHTITESPTPADADRPPALAEPVAEREPPRAPETGARVSTDRLHALIARGLRVLAGTTNPEAPVEGTAKRKSADAKSSRKDASPERDARAGLLDRRSLLKLLRTESDRANRYKQPLSLGLIAIRDLEKLRAERGVPFRDAVLRSYVRYMESGFRSCDVIVRIGTDRFVVVLPHTTAEGATGALNKLAAATRDATVADGNERVALPGLAAKSLTYREKEDAGEFLARARTMLKVMTAGLGRH
jgi:diguanylate cyclase (GGDEF)-like protein